MATLLRANAPATTTAPLERCREVDGAASTIPAVSRSLLERRLDELTSRLRALREELRVADEQLAVLVEEADDTRLRALVSETPLAEREHEEAQRHADAMARHRSDLVAQLADLEHSQDELLDRLMAEPSESR
jgi:chromosome segregation ATPase